MKKIIFFIAALLFSLTLPGCSGKGDKEFPVIELTINGHLFQTEIADTPEERGKGYMDRQNIRPDEAMLFVFPGDQRLNFWMKNTPTPLSIAYIDAQGVIREIYDMQPFSERPVSSLSSVRYALEVVQGRFNELEIQPGDRVEAARGGLPVTRE